MILGSSMKTCALVLGAGLKACATAMSGLRSAGGHACLLLVALAVVALPAETKLMPIDEIRPGMIGTGQTVFQGTELQEFKAHIIGVLHNVQGPRRSLILAKLEGGPLADTGVIAGMSG